MMTVIKRTKGQKEVIDKHEENCFVKRNKNTDRKLIKKQQHKKR